MHTVDFDLGKTIADLADLDCEGRLAELLTQYSLACRGMPSDRGQLFLANELIHVAVVAKALAVMFDLPDGECLAAVRRMLLRHPRRDVALELIDEFLGRTNAATAPGSAGGSRATPGEPNITPVIRGRRSSPSPRVEAQPMVYLEGTVQ
jgi:hypothetical protein